MVPGPSRSNATPSRIRAKPRSKASGWAVVAEGLGKRYGDRWALRDVDLYAPARTVLAIAGPTGAGKTTLLQILASHTPPTTGYARVQNDGAEVLLLDEPDGLDRGGRAELRSMLRRCVTAAARSSSRPSASSTSRTSPTRSCCSTAAGSSARWRSRPAAAATSRAEPSRFEGDCWDRITATVVLVAGGERQRQSVGSLLRHRRQRLLEPLPQLLSPPLTLLLEVGHEAPQCGQSTM